jgi:hypothetical protein
MISRRKLLLALATAAVAPLSAFGQPKPGRIARIGLLSYLSEPDIALTLTASQFPTPFWCVRIR